jgi:Helix-turn-helix
MTQDVWASELTARIAAEIKRLRADRSAQWLSDRTAELGYRVARSRISDLEVGRRTRIDIGELLILARALGVSPTLLAFPLGRQESVEVVPGQELDTWMAVKWFAGMSVFPGDLPEGNEVPAVGEDFRAWQAATAPVYYFQQHQDAVADWMVAKGDYPEGLRRAVSALRWLRNSMRRAGLTPPTLTPELERAVAERTATPVPADQAGTSESAEPGALS